MVRTGLICSILVPLVICSAPVHAKITVALTPLGAGDGYDRERNTVSQVMQAELSQSTNLTLLDRDELNKALDELKLAQRGGLPTDSVQQLGKIVGARYFCSGSVAKAGDKAMAIARVVEIDSTLTELAYSFLTSNDDAVEAGKALASQVESIIVRCELERTDREKQAAAEAAKRRAKAIPNDWKRPTVMVIILERHVRQPEVIDPAGETEITKRLLADDFRVIDSEYVHLMAIDQDRSKSMFGSLRTSTQYAAQKGADILLYGEAISEGAARLGDFEGCRGRIEIKAVSVKNDEILVADSAEGGATDLAEAVAGKKAIQQAADRLADTFLYSLAEKWNKTK